MEGRRGGTRQREEKGEKNELRGGRGKKSEVIFPDLHSEMDVRDLDNAKRDEE